MIEKPPINFKKQYASFLRQYIHQPDELLLDEATTIGKRILEGKIGLLELADVHHETLAEVMRQEDMLSHETLNHSNSFLLAALVPSNMAAEYTHVIRDLLANNEKLQKQKMELEEVNADLEQFNFLASHDLQEPIRNLSIFCELLPQYLEMGKQEKVLQAVAHIQAATQSIKNLVKSLLNYSCLKDEISFEAVAPKVCIEEAIQNVQHLNADARVHVDEYFPEVYGDASLITHLYINLIGNALKYAQKEAPTIHVGVRSTPEGQSIFYVEDNGMGIEEIFLKNIFLPFKRFHTDKNIKGTGIGLSICKRIVEKHYGRIWVESRVNKGTTFFFTLKELRK